MSKTKQKYRTEYTKEWPVLRRSKKSDYHVYCEPCKSEISVQYGGRDDCRRHINSAKHRDNARRVAENTDVRTFFSINTEQLNVTRAEIAMVNFLIEHNLSLAAADHATSMFNTVFVDSKIAKNFEQRLQMCYTF